MSTTDQRYYASTYGRFNTADPYQASGGPSDPGSWNRYSYTRGDPINRLDPRGLEDCPPGVDFCVTGTAVADSPDPSPCSEFAVMAPWAAAYLSSIGACGVPSEYGGGGGAAQKPFVPPPPLPFEPSSPEQQKRSLDTAYELAEELLSIPNCAGLFNIGGEALSPQSMLTQLFYGTPMIGKIAWLPLDDVTAATFQIAAASGAGGLVYLNSDLNGSWFQSNKLQNAQTLLHELGHVYVDIFGPGSTAIVNGDANEDPTSVANQHANNSAIETNCARTGR